MPLFDTTSLQRQLAQVAPSAYEDSTARTDSTPAHKHSPFVTAAILGGNIFDGVTSAVDLAHGGREAYPLLPQSALGNAAMKGLVTAGELYGVRKLEETHPRAAKVLAGILGGLSGAAGVNNLKTYQQLTK